MLAKFNPFETTSCMKFYRKAWLIIIVQNAIPFVGYSAMSLFALCFMRKDSLEKVIKYGDKSALATTFVHEATHALQWLVITLIALLIFALLSIFANWSWWLLLISPSIYYLIYGLHYLILRFSGKDHKAAYYAICFEKHAYAHQNAECSKGWCKYLHKVFNEASIGTMQIGTTFKVK